jgi:sRNA-binding regulator protein Hfq
MSINRKLIRPDMTAARQAAATGRKKAPPTETAAEAFYFVKQMAGKTPMVVVTMDGEVLNGVIEWYDEGAIKLHRRGAPNLLLMKHAIKYMHKEGDMGSLDEAPPREDSEG